MDAFATAHEMLRSLDAGTVTSLELVALHLERIDRFDADLGAFVTVDAPGVRTAAREADAARASIRHGRVSDDRRDVGARRAMPDTDAMTVRRLRAAGAIVLGKTNLPAGVSGQETANRVAGRTSNPWDRTRTAGGSSGGAAAALAASASSPCRSALARRSASVRGIDVGGGFRICRPVPRCVASVDPATIGGSERPESVVVASAPAVRRR